VRCGEFFNNHFIANLLQLVSEKELTRSSAVAVIADRTVCSSTLLRDFYFNAIHLIAASRPVNKNEVQSWAFINYYTGKL